MGKRSDETLYALPEVSELPFSPQDALEITTLLNEAHSLTHVEERLKVIKARLVELTQAYGGTRIRNHCVIVRFQGGQRRISSELLIENGVTPQQIEWSTKQGEGYWVCELPKASPIL